MTYHKSLLCVAGLVGGLSLVTGAVVFMTGCGREPTTTSPNVDVGPPPGLSTSEVPVPKVHFRDITAKAGIDFHHTNGAFGKKMMPETLGSGVVFLDYDDDGYQDILFVNSCAWPGYESKSELSPTPKLYRNNHDGTFTDVTKETGLDVTIYGMGATAGDFNNDGHVDLFITALGGCRLFQNVDNGGKRKFIDVTEKAGAFAPVGGWSTKGDFLEREEPMDFPTSAAFLDYDNDGLLDLFVCQYVTWSPKFDLSQKFKLKGGKERAYGPPQHFVGTFCRLFHNDGDGKFRDVSKEAGIQVLSEKPPYAPGGKSLGVLVWDADGDGYPDIFVANDTVRNFFFHNQGDGTFKERGIETGFAYAAADARGGMGIDCAEYRPGKYAIAIGNFANEPTTLFCLEQSKKLEQAKKLFFSDVAGQEGVGGPSRPMLTFGLFFFDYDLDGRLDHLSCNGHLEPEIQSIESNQSYKQPAQLFWNSGSKKRAYELVKADSAGPDLFVPIVGRGCAFGDIDNDGSLDVVLMGNGGPARLLRNEGGTGNHWVRLVLKGDGKKVNTSAIGAVVTLYAGDTVQHRQVASGRGYLSQSELPLTFGLGKASTIDKIEIRWPGKDIPTQTVTGLAVDKIHVIEMNANK